MSLLKFLFSAGQQFDRYPVKIKYYIKLQKAHSKCGYDYFLLTTYLFFKCFQVFPAPVKPQPFQGSSELTTSFCMFSHLIWSRSLLHCQQAVTEVWRSHRNHNNKCYVRWNQISCLLISYDRRNTGLSLLPASYPHLLSFFFSPHHSQSFLSLSTFVLLPVLNLSNVSHGPLAFSASSPFLFTPCLQIIVCLNDKFVHKSCWWLTYL